MLTWILVFFKNFSYVCYSLSFESQAKGFLSIQFFFRLAPNFLNYLFKGSLSNTIHTSTNFCTLPLPKAQSVPTNQVAGLGLCKNYISSRCRRGAKWFWFLWSKAVSCSPFIIFFATGISENRRMFTLVAKKQLKMSCSFWNHVVWDWKISRSF